MEHSDNTFEYTYCAPDREEVRRIREKYLPKEEDKMEQLRRLDRNTTRKGTAWSLVVGILGVLIMGCGMSCCMVGPAELMFPGILVGIVGMLIAGLAYPIFARITTKEREKITPEILRLTDELMK